MKVAFLSTVSSSIGNAYHQRLRMLASGLRAEGIQTDFLYFRDMFPGTPILLQPISCLKNFDHLRKFDVLHGGDTGGTYAGFPFKMRLPIPMVQDIHGDAVQDHLLFYRHQPWNLRKLFHVAQAGIAEYVANHIADYCIVVSEFQRKRLLLKGFPSLNVEMVRNGVDTSLFRPDGGESNGKFVVCYAGAMQEYQDIESLVRAFKGIKNQDVKLKLIGFADEDQGLKRRISGILKERVELYDKMPQEEMIRHLGSADVLVLPRKKHPSMLYGFPVKFAEYIAMGKTVIVSDADETSELVRKHRCGLVYEASDSGSLQRSLLEAIGSSKDMRLKMGTNARRLAVAEFDWSKIASRYSVFLANVIKDYKERSK